jgi:molybdopterin-containing oxidoreductase family membrane subunit
MEFFTAWYSGSPYERYVFFNRAFGPYAWAYWAMISCNVISPQFFWVKSFRYNIPLMFVISITINIGMWFERFVIIVTSLHRDFIPGSWGYFHATIWDICTYLGTFGVFFTLFLLFVRWFPMIAIAEVKATLQEADPHAAHGGDAHGHDHGHANHAHGAAE